MPLYTRSQLVVLLAVVSVAGVGLGVGHWRRTHPHLVARLEALDRPREPADAAADAAAQGQSLSAPSPPPSAEHSISAARSRAGSAAQPWRGPRADPTPPDPFRRSVTEDEGVRARPPGGAPPARPIDVNRATEGELRTLPGIGDVLAARIVQARERDGPFVSLDDLGRVPGLGRAKLGRLAAAVALPP
jgi:competence ComEA-like helix-hairpin-helix protein